MYLLKKIAIDELNFIQNTVYLCIMLCTRDFDRIYINCNDYRQ